MSADYWKSSQYQEWTFSREQLAEKRKGLQAPVTAWNGNVRIFIFEQVQQLGQRLNSRQRAIATAHVYLLRAFTRIRLSEINVFLLVATALYVACKAEEQPLHIRTVCNEARVLWPDLMPQDALQIAECEFYLIDELQSCLIVHHGYRSLRTLQSSMEEATGGILSLSASEKEAVWSVITVSYSSDTPLLFAPHIVAAAAIYVTILLRPDLSTLSKHPTKVKNRIDFLASYLGRSGISLDNVAECVQELLSSYYRWSIYDPDEARKAVGTTLS